MREDRVNPRYSHAAHADHSEYCGHKRNTEASEIAGHNLVQHTEYIGKKDIHKARISELDNLRVTVKNREQKSACRECCRNGNSRSDRVLADAQSKVLDAYADLELAKQAQANALAQLNAAKQVLGSLVPYVVPAQPQVTTTTTTTTTKTPAKAEKKADEKKADEAALPTTGDSVAAQVTIIAGLGAAAIAAGATRRRFNA